VHVILNQLTQRSRHMQLQQLSSPVVDDDDDIPDDVIADDNDYISCRNM